MVAQSHRTVYRAIPCAHASVGPRNHPGQRGKWDAALEGRCGCSRMCTAHQLHLSICWLRASDAHSTGYHVTSEREKIWELGAGVLGRPLWASGTQTRGKERRRNTWQVSCDIARCHRHPCPAAHGRSSASFSIMAKE